MLFQHLFLVILLEIQCPITSHPKGMKKNTSKLIKSRSMNSHPPPGLHLTWVSILIQVVHVLRLSDPVHVSTQILLHLLFLPQFLEISSSFGLLPFFTELSAAITQTMQTPSLTSLTQNYPNVFKKNTNPLRTPRTRLRTKKEPKITRLTK